MGGAAVFGERLGFPFAALFWFCLVLSCSARGPVFPKAPLLKPLAFQASYRFTLDPQFYHKKKKALANELYFEKARSRIPKTRFVMRSLGQNAKGSLRQRSYEGLAYRLDSGKMELRAERCYLYGKQDWEDPIFPLERWDCDHLFFVYQSPSHFRRRDVLKPLQTERTRYSKWFSTQALIPMPLPLDKVSLTKPAFFAGQIISLEESPKSKLVVVWGYGGGRLLRKGQILRAQDKKGMHMGRLKVLSRPGDFIICRWLGPHRPQAHVAYALAQAASAELF